ncbi:lycopene beta-cyclase CrtY [Acuticoccus mangrovi]|uniref:Lycopene beta-cyclase CrtY n=1 Tax=Acuticoccus mangrovi TaxID=2796142 RepID=A0A934MP34_9HYPH|nr:lycopene beta-cyclase CrtY [Acuticoccus mangrovi]MBJ3778739.1 lycopene beta-cyclase CrtY [Acuticoccus mangrovi]
MAQRLIIAGGGLAGVLTAMALLRLRPDVSLTLVEADARLGGVHTWSFYQSDLDAAATALVDPFVVHRWPGYETRFDGFARTFSTPYRAISSARLHAVATAALGARVRLGTAVAEVAEDGVRLADGRRLEADAVIDARGPAALAGTVLRFQKFLGRTLRLAAPHGLTRPIIMDATVPQLDGYRFVYTLPLDADTVLVEDTTYGDDPTLDRPALAARIDAYAAAMGWRVAAIAGEETGALPLLLACDVEALWAGAAPAGAGAPIGLRAGLFHPVTGYSLPMAARTALALANGDGPLTTRRLRASVEAIVRRHVAATLFDRMLNRMLFLAGRPQDRHRVLARFHRLPQPLIERFYAGRLPRHDKLRILLGKPPVPLLEALRALPEAAARRPLRRGGAAI